jgi:hypothetical protein
MAPIDDRPVLSDDELLARAIGLVRGIARVASSDLGFDRPLRWYLAAFGPELESVPFDLDRYAAGADRSPSCSLQELRNEAVEPHGSTTARPVIAAVDVFPKPWAKLLRTAVGRHVDLRYVSTHDLLDRSARAGVDLAAQDVGLLDAWSRLSDGRVGLDEAVEGLASAVVAASAAGWTREVAGELSGDVALVSYIKSPSLRLLLAETRERTGTALISCQHGGNYLEGPTDLRELGEVWASDAFVAWSGGRHQSFGTDVEVIGAPSPRLHVLPYLATRQSLDPRGLRSAQRARSSICWVTDFVRMQMPMSHPRWQDPGEYDALRGSFLRHAQPRLGSRLQIRERPPKATDEAATSQFTIDSRRLGLTTSTLGYETATYFSACVVVDRPYSTTFLHRIYENRPVVLLSGGAVRVQPHLEPLVDDLVEAGVIADPARAAQLLGDGVDSWWGSARVQEAVGKAQEQLSGSRAEARFWRSWHELLTRGLA